MTAPHDPAPLDVAALDALHEMTQSRALAWVVSGDTGSSSTAIWSHMMGVGMPGNGWRYPLDPDDFGRCYRLLARIPAWRARIGEMAQHGRCWAGLAAAWDELTALYEDEIGMGLHHHYGRAPRLYDRMHAIEDAARALPPERAP